MQQGTPVSVAPGVIPPSQAGASPHLPAPGFPVALAPGFPVASAPGFPVASAPGFPVPSSDRKPHSSVRSHPNKQSVRSRFHRSGLAKQCCCCPFYDKLPNWAQWMCSVPACLLWVVFFGFSTYGLVILGLNHGFDGGFKFGIEELKVNEVPQFPGGSSAPVGKIDMNLRFLIENGGMNELGFKDVNGRVFYHRHDIGGASMEGDSIRPSTTSRHDLSILSNDLRDLQSASGVLTLTQLLRDYASKQSMTLDINLKLNDAYLKLHFLDARLWLQAETTCTMELALDEYESLLQGDGAAWQKAAEQDDYYKLCSIPKTSGSLPTLAGFCFLLYFCSLFCFCGIPIYRYVQAPERVRKPLDSE